MRKKANEKVVSYSLIVTILVTLIASMTLSQFTSVRAENNETNDNPQGETILVKVSEDSFIETINPIADTYIQIGEKAGTSFGDSDLNIKGDPNGKNYRIGYLKFDFGEANYVENANLKLYVSDLENSKEKYNLRFVGFDDSTWDETMTWNSAQDKAFNDQIGAKSAPLTEYGPLGTFIKDLATEAGTTDLIEKDWINVDVTEFVNSQLAQDKKIISFKVYDPNHVNAYVKLDSKEKANQPIIEFKKGERPVSSDANLTSLVFDQGILAPEFNQDILEYTLDVFDTTGKITVSPQASSEAIKSMFVKANGVETKVEGDVEVVLTSKDTSMEIVVTAEDNTTKTYKVNVSKSLVDPSQFDMNGNGTVEVGDLAYISARFGSTLSSEKWDEKADLNGDEIIDKSDIEIIKNYIVGK